MKIMQILGCVKFNIQNYFLNMLFICFISNFSFAQTNPEIDSLLKVLKKASDKDKISIYSQLCFQYSYFDIEKSFKYGKEGISLSKNLGDELGEAHCLIELSNPFIAESKYDSAEIYLNSALKIYKKDESNNIKLISTCYNMLGNLYVYQSNNRKALEFYNDALLLTSDLKDKKFEGELLGNLGAVYSNLDNNEKAIEFQIKALKIHDSTGNKLASANAHGTIGQVYGKIKQYALAIQSLRKALEIFLELQDKEGAGLCQNLISEYTYYEGKYSESQGFALKARQHYQEIGNKNGLAGVELQLGKIALKLNKNEKALKYLKKAILLSDEVENPSIKLSVYQELTKLFLQQNNVSEARKNIILAESLADSLESRDLKEHIYILYAQIEAASGNFKGSYEYLMKHNALKDSLYSFNSNEKIANLNATYQLDKKEAQIALHQNELKFQSTINYITFGFLFVVCIFVILLIINIRKTKVLNRLLEDQNHEIQATNENLSLAYQEIEHNHNQIKQSLNYAQRIQQAMVPSESELQSHFQESFVFWAPKETVSGDFYWIKETEDRIYVAAVDCTGHGVPGAFMSMIGINILDQIIDELNITETDKILNELDKKVKKTLHQHGSDAKDGMDMTLVAFYKNENKFDFSGAKNPIVLVENGKSVVLKGDKMAIGGFERGKEDNSFTLHQYNFTSPIQVYLFTDGYQDQIGGEKNRKFMVKTFYELIQNLQVYKTIEQKEKFEMAFMDWKMGKNQTDDVLLIGIQRDTFLI